MIESTVQIADESPEARRFDLSALRQRVRIDQVQMLRIVASGARTYLSILFGAGFGCSRLLRRISPS